MCQLMSINYSTSANVDTAGMYSWTALLVATQHGHRDCVALLLDKKPNINAIDKGKNLYIFIIIILI
jgi:ankyrin repeat protein